MVEHELPKLVTWVRFPSPAPSFLTFGGDYLQSADDIEAYLNAALEDGGNPRFSSLVAILRAMGLELAVRSRRDAA